MSEWKSVELKFNLLSPIVPAVEISLQAVQVVEAILEALLGLIKVFFLDLSNPLTAIIETLLAAVRAIINQILSAGFATLFVRPDFSQTGFDAIMNSVRGGYQGFESKVVSKFFDPSDIFRPQYPPGAASAMLVFYIGANDPGTLIKQIFALKALFSNIDEGFRLPGPVDLKALPVNKSGSSVSQFRHLFDSDLNKAIQLEWRMPQSPSGMRNGGFSGQIVSFYDSFIFPNFIIERHGPFPQDKVDPSGKPELNPQGEIVYKVVNSGTLGKLVDKTIEKFNHPKVQSKTAIIEEDGSVHRVFNTKLAISYDDQGEVDTGTVQGKTVSALAQGSTLATGIATGKYKYLDEDPALISGKTYYYRVRAFFGDSSIYTKLSSVSDVENSDLVVQESSNNYQVLKLSAKGLSLSTPSQTVRGFVPRFATAEIRNNTLDLYDDVYNAMMVGLLLNFELPSANSQDTPRRAEQKTGWGSLSVLGGQAGPVKSAFSNSADFVDNVLIVPTIRRLCNSVSEKIITQPSFYKILAGLWKNQVHGLVHRLIVQYGNENVTWGLMGVIGGISNDTNDTINTYLSLEDNYKPDVKTLDGPLPTDPGKGYYASIIERQKLSTFLTTVLSVSNSQSSYLSWYSLTLSDLIPAIPPFLFDFEQFLLSFLKACQSALSEIADIIDTLIQKIKALEQILQALIDLLNLFSINITLSVLAISSNGGPVTPVIPVTPAGLTGPVGPAGGAEALVNGLLSSENKPDLSSGYYSGLVLTCGGPGVGFITAFQAIRFIFGLGGPI